MTPLAWLLTGGACLLAVLCYLRLWMHYRRNLRKIRFMFDAISNLDTSFRFVTETGNREERLVNESLNRIKQLIEDAREAAREQERYHALIIDHVETGIMVINPEGHVLQHNAATLRLTGLSVLNHVSQFARISDTLHRDIATLKAGERRLVTFQNEWGEIHLSMAATALTLRGGALVKLVTLNDVNTAIDQNEMDSWLRLSRVLTHEIMNGVTPITSLSETLLQKMTDAPSVTPPREWVRAVETIRSTGKDLMTFVENYRKFTHIPTPQPSLFYVKPFVERMVSLARERVRDKVVTFEVKVEPADLILYADEQLIGHVVSNILKNAVEAISREGTVWLEACTNKEEAVLLTVTNNGEPIPEDVAAHIFIPFFTTKRDGCGVGLSVARQVMRLSGGSISLHSDRVRGLTTFTLCFP